MMKWRLSPLMRRSADDVAASFLAWSWFAGLFAFAVVCRRFSGAESPAAAPFNEEIQTILSKHGFRDLMGIDFKADEEFPPDDTVHGFDNEFRHPATHPETM